MHYRRWSFAFGLLPCLPCLAVVLGACGTAPASSFKDKEQGGSTPLPGGNGAGGGFGVGEEGDTTPPVDLQACATSSAKAEGSKVYLVFMFDRSGSMAGDRWTACKAATEAFFASNDSKGLSASLSYFPVMGLLLTSCDVAKYSQPAVPMTSLPNGAFKTSLEGETPAGGTPTGVALSGAIQYANKLRQGQAKDGKVAIVLVTDGAPEGCDGDPSKIAANVKDTIPTYVIGVGEIANLNALAQAGGTKSAFVVPADDPAKIQGDFLKAVDSIKSAALACDYTIPAPPNGEKLDRGKVNVVHTPKGAEASTLHYNQSCEGGKGWRYDDANAPTRILMCEQSCESVKTTPGSIDVLFGCETKTGGVK